MRDHARRIQGLLLVAMCMSACSVDSRRLTDGRSPEDLEGEQNASAAQSGARSPSAAGGAMSGASTEGNGVAPGNGTGQAAGGSSAMTVPGNPKAAVDPPGPAPAVNVTIQGAAVNPALSSIGLLPGAGGQQYVGTIEVSSVACFDRADLNGAQSIDVSYSRDSRAEPSSARFAIQWGSADVTLAENLGEKVITDTGGW